jgi:PAS domain S-box-containing protein
MEEVNGKFRGRVAYTLSTDAQKLEGPSGRYERLYHMLMEAIPSSILMIDRNLRIVAANRNFLEKSKRAVYTTVGLRLEEVFPQVILERINIIEQIRDVFDTGLPSRGRRMTYRTPGVPMRVYYYRVLPFSWKGTVENVMLLMDDVTEQVRLSEEVRRIERHMASVFESASDIIVSTDIHGGILSWNPAAERLTGYSFLEVRGMPFFDYLAAEHRQVALEVFSLLERRNEECRLTEWGLVTKDGKTMQVSWVCSVMKDGDSNAVGMVTVGRDLTERRKLELQLFQSQKSAALGVMAGGIAHEIRNPLAIASSAAQFLMDDDITSDFRKECANKIHIGIKRASGIIENLLKFARLSNRPQTESVDVCFLIKESINLVENQARIEKIQINGLIPKEPLMIRGNAGVLQQALLNLFLNGINAMPEGGILTVSAEVEKGAVMIKVIDTGIGISKEDIDKIFDPFYTVTTMGKGTGLGLSICFSVFEQHGGTIEAESVPGEGSCFIVRLPLA